MKTLTGIALLVFAHFWPMDSFACSLEDGYLEPSNYNLVQEEEVDSEDSPWLTTVKHYVRIGTLRNYEQEKSELRKLQSLVRQTLDVQRGLESLVVDVDYPLLEADRLARKIVQANNVSDALTLRLSRIIQSQSMGETRGFDPSEG